MTTPDQIRFAYSSTSQGQRGLKIEDLFNGEDDQKIRALIEIIRYMRIGESLFGIHIIYDSWGICGFHLLYRVDPFELRIGIFTSNSEFPFNTVQGFADWLNECERKVLEAAANLTFDTFEEEIK